MFLMPGKSERKFEIILAFPGVPVYNKNVRTFVCMYG